MALPLSDLFFLVLGALVGGYFQAGRERVKRIRNDVCELMADEIRSAKLNGDIDQEDRWTTWTELDDLVKRELPNGLRKEFSRYFQLVIDLDEEKDRLGYRNQELGSTFADGTVILEWENDDLHVATAEYDLPTKEDTEIRYGAEFENWVLEYGPILSDLFEEQDSPYPIPEKVEDAIRSHEPDHHEFQNLCETWDSITEDGWSELIHDLYLSAESDRYSLYLKLMERNKRKIKESAQTIDKWFTIIANTNIYFLYWLTIKKLIAEIRESGVREVFENDTSHEAYNLSELE
ncbi:hypothetical protein [Halococcus saccharolyticus]|nr:hypothetical protein [Halococcus saccharolyticus]